MADVTDTYYEGQAIHGYGAQLLVGSGGSPQTFDAVADITTITPGEMTTAVIDKTHLRSPRAHREKLAGIRDSGPFTLVGNWRPSHESQNNAGGGAGAFATGGLCAMWVDRSEHDFKIQLGDTSGSPPIEWPFRGVVTRFQPGEIGIDDKINFTAEVTPLSDYSASLP